MLKVQKIVNVVKEFFTAPHSPRAYVWWCVGIFAAVMLLSALLVWGIDPCMRYRHRGIFRPVYDKAHLKIPGILRNCEYDSLIVGTSMCQNFNLRSYREICGGNAVKATAPGSRSGDMKEFLELAVEFKGDKLQQVLIGIDVWSFGPPWKVRQAGSNFLYRRDYWQDFRYFWDGHIWSESLLPLLGGEIRKNKKLERERDYAMMFCWHASRFNWGEEAVRQAIRGMRGRLVDVVAPATAAEYFQRSIAPVIAGNPAKKFTLIFPPYSIVFWCQLATDGQLNAFLGGKAAIMTEALKYSNVKLLDFQADADIILNLNNYKDVTHFHPAINDRLLRHLADSSREVRTAADIERCEQALRALISRHTPDLRRRNLLAVPADTAD